MKLLLLCVPSGILCGLGAYLLSFLLEWATNYRSHHLWIIWFLPLAGLLIGLIYHHFGQAVNAGTDLILDEIHHPQKILPIRKAPFILFSTVITHLFGGPSGREGTAVQMGVALTDRLQGYFHLKPRERSILLIAAMGASFGAILGTPVAGIFFGLEVISIGRFKMASVAECALTSFVAYGVCSSLRHNEFFYSKLNIPTLEVKNIFWILLAGIIFGLVSRVFVKFRNFIAYSLAQFITYPPLRTFVGGGILVLLFYWEGSHKFVGLGLSGIREAFITTDNFPTPLLKLVVSALAVACGLKGGEFIPLVFIGTTLGSALGTIFPISFQLLAAVGFVAVFAAASNAPLTLSIAAIEIFGLSIAPYAFLACYMAYYCSGHAGIYQAQKIYLRKHQRVLLVLRWLGALPGKFFKK